MQGSLEVYKRIGINVVRLGVLSGAILVALVLVIGGPLIFYSSSVGFIGSAVFSGIGAFFVFWGTLYPGIAILRISEKASEVLKRFIA